MSYYPRRKYSAHKKPASISAKLFARKNNDVTYIDGAGIVRRKPAPVDTIVFNGEHGPKTFYRNVRGRCEDAPCCGCCTI